jgi:nucleotide-binding universal stress UspA family protein
MSETRAASVETVLVAVGSADGDRVDALVDAAVEVARPNHTTVVLGHAFEPDSYPAVLDRLGYDEDDDVTPDDVAARQAGVKRARDRLADTGVDHAVRGTVADRGPGVVELAEAVDADRVVVGGQGRSPAGKAIFGSTAQTILLNAPCPATFVRGE